MPRKKTVKRILSYIMTAVIVTIIGVPTLAATVTGDKLVTFSLSRETLVARVQANMLTNTYGVAQFFNIESLSYDDFQVAVSTAKRGGAKIHLCFDTLIKDEITARIMLNPSFASKKVGDVKLTIDISDKTNKSVRDKFETQFGRTVAVMKTAHTGDFGMKVIMAGKLDLGQIDKNNLHAYRYDAELNQHYKIDDSHCTVDENGFVFLATDAGGYIIITDYDEG